MTSAATLVYVHDPMCSWCWGFQNAYSRLRDALPAAVAVKTLLGGLAPDSDAPMPPQMQLHLQQIWRRIESTVPGAGFNHDFWRRCNPRRSTWPACRAVLAARTQGKDSEMTAAIQRGYYLQARNPSDDATLIEFAAELNMDTDAFRAALHSAEVQRQLENEIASARELGAHGFPSLFLLHDNMTHSIGVNYTDAQPMLDEVCGVIGGVNAINTGDGETTGDK